MQTGFQITPENIVFVRNGGAIYRDTLENFASDYGEAAPALPDGATQMLYEPGVRHMYAGADGVVGGGELPWSWGDTVVSSCGDILDAKAAREAAAYVPPPPPDPGSIVPRLIASAFSVAIADGDVADMSGVYNLVAAIYLDVGQYMLLFIEPQPDDQYFVVASGDAPCLRVVDRQTDYLIIEARDAVGGNYVDAGLMSVQAYRV